MKGPMSSKNMSYTIESSVSIPSIHEVLPVAITQNAKDFLNPPIKNIGYINAASRLLLAISEKEKETMGLLLTLS